MRCRKCWNENLVDASAELVGASAEPGTWMKCFQCGWRGRPLTGRVTVAQDTETKRRHCHSPGIRTEFCTGYPLKNQDYCRACMKKRDPLRVKPTRAVPIVEAEVEVGEDGGAKKDTQVRSPGVARALAMIKGTSVLDRMIAKLADDLALLERAREILQREA